jgi:hypothetical protein
MMLIEGTDSRSQRKVWGALLLLVIATGCGSSARHNSAEASAPQPVVVADQSFGEQAEMPTMEESPVYESSNKSGTPMAPTHAKSASRFDSSEDPALGYGAALDDDATKDGNDGPEPAPVEAEPKENRKPLLIYQAVLGLAVFRVTENLDSIESRADALGGYMLRRGGTNITVRVPAAKFQILVAEILKMGEVHHRTITAQDVTAEYTDIQIRLKNALAVRERLAMLLAQAKNVEEALAVEAQLGRLSEEIERMKGRLKLLSELSAYSTITVEFSEKTSQIDGRVELPFGWLKDIGLRTLLDL